MIHALALLLLAATHGTAFVDVRKIEAMPELRPFFAAYDREMTALKATQHVPQLTDTRALSPQQAAVVQRGAQAASHALDQLRPLAANYSVEDAYAREASGMQNRAQASASAYRAQLQREAAHQLQAYRASLDSRVNGAYAARAQQLREKEADLEIRLDKQDADQDLVLRVKLQNLKGPTVDRPALAAKLHTLEARENRLRAALEARDAATLAAYRARLVASASHEYARMAGEVQRRAQANWQLRQRVAAAQAHAPERLTMPDAGSVSFLQRSNGFTAAASDITQRFNDIGTMDTAARGAAANEIIALQRYRAALTQEIDRRARAIAAQLAKSRGLALSVDPVPGAVDLTSAVMSQMRCTVALTAACGSASEGSPL